MPPRILATSRFSVSKLCIRPAPTLSTPTTSTANVATFAQRRKHKDPYVLAQAKQRKDANMSRRAELEKERNIALGDPVRGVNTPFLNSFDDVGGSVTNSNTSSASNTANDTAVKAGNDLPLNHYLNATELERAIARSRALTEPEVKDIRDGQDPAVEAERRKAHEENHARAVTAISRILDMANASQKDKTRANVRRCIDTFGRHKTDEVLEPRAALNPTLLDGKPDLPKRTPRAGPDTGSSEVQIAVLTAKIRVLANQLESYRGYKDKVNKRNLRILVHKRQKLLKYLRSKERGGARWKHLVETLGLTEGTWKGEISL